MGDSRACKNRSIRSGMRKSIISTERKRMKKLLFGTGLVATLLLGSCDLLSESGSYFNSGTVQLKSDKVGRLEATGKDLRVYEFTPQTATNKQCIFVSGTSKAGLVCFDKEK